MRIISEKRFKEFVRIHAAATPSMANFVKILRDAAWNSMQDVRGQFPHADQVHVLSGRVVTVFNVGGGNYRVVLRLTYNYGIAYVLAVMTHAEYGKGDWKEHL